MKIYVVNRILSKSIRNIQEAAQVKHAKKFSLDGHSNKLAEDGNALIFPEGIN